jgi:hypothetical protein
MLIIKERKKYEFNEVFKANNDFNEFLLLEYNKLNFDNDDIQSSIKILYDKLVNDEGVVKYLRLTRWVSKEFKFKCKNILQECFWLERGWSSNETKEKISNIMVERSNKASITKSELKKDIIFDDTEKDIKYNKIKFKSIHEPRCGKCNSTLELKKRNKNNILGDFYYEIIKCSNDSCETHNMGRNNKYRAFLPSIKAECIINEITNNIKGSNKLCVKSWINKGYSEKEAKNIISEIQSTNSKLVKNRFIVSKENLKMNGFSDDEIIKICQTPTRREFYEGKGLTDDEITSKIRKQQKYAASFVDYEKRLLPSNIEYWVNKGHGYIEAKQKVIERQTTFSREICIEKYGEIEGLKVFTERQNKWSKSLNNGGKMKNGYSKISQHLFHILLNSYEVDDRVKIMFATHNGEFKLNKCENEGGIWMYDFTDVKNKKIIEYHGDMFHGNPKKYLAEDYPHPFRKTITAQEMWDKDKKKMDIAYQNGFEVLVIWDSEYRWGNKQKIIDKCLAFINK